MIHRAMLGSLERFLGSWWALAGNPRWLAPEQLVWCRSPRAESSPGVGRRSAGVACGGLAQRKIGKSATLN
jgi:hypothetical protein